MCYWWAQQTNKGFIVHVHVYNTPILPKCNNSFCVILQCATTVMTRSSRNGRVSFAWGFPSAPHLAAHRPPDRTDKLTTAPQTGLTSPQKPHTDYTESLNGLSNETQGSMAILYYISPFCPNSKQKGARQDGLMGYAWRSSWEQKRKGRYYTRISSLSPWSGDCS